MPDEIKGTDAVSASPDADSLFYLLKITERGEIGNRDPDGSVKEFFDIDDIGVIQSTALLQDFNADEFIEIPGQVNDKWVNGDGSWGGLNDLSLLVPESPLAFFMMPKLEATWTAGATDRDTELNAALAIKTVYEGLNVESSTFPPLVGANLFTYTDGNADPSVGLTPDVMWSLYGSQIKNLLKSSIPDLASATQASDIITVLDAIIAGKSFTFQPGSNFKFVDTSSSNVIEALNKFYGPNTSIQKDVINSPTALKDFSTVESFVETQINRTTNFFGNVFNSPTFWNEYKALTNTSNLTSGVAQNFLLIQQITGQLSTGLSFTGLSDTPTGYDDGKILQSTTTGLAWVDMPVGGGAPDSVDDITDLPDNPTDGQLITVGCDLYIGCDGQWVKVGADAVAPPSEAPACVSNLEEYNQYTEYKDQFLADNSNASFSAGLNNQTNIHDFIHDVCLFADSNLSQERNTVVIDETTYKWGMFANNQNINIRAQAFSDSNVASCTFKEWRSNLPNFPKTNAQETIFIDQDASITGHFECTVAPSQPSCNQVALHLQPDTGETIADKSDNQHTVTTVGDTVVDNTATLFGGGTMNFDGNGDALSVGDTSTFKFLHDDTTDYTVEFWHRLDQINQNNHVLATIITSSSEVGIFSNVRQNGQLYYHIHRGQDSTIFKEINSQIGTISANVWNHVVIVNQVGQDLKMYLNGVSISDQGSSFTKIASPSANNHGSALHIGGVLGQLSNGSMNGQIQDLRISKKVVYTANFTPPTNLLGNPCGLPGDQPSCSEVDFHLQASSGGTVEDKSDNNRTITNPNNAFIDNSETLFNESTFFFDSNKFLTFDSGDLAANDFTIEFWIKYDTAITTSTKDIITRSGGGGNATTEFSIVLNQDTLRFVNNLIVESTSTGMASVLNNWTHIAMVRSSNSFHLYVNGQREIDTAMNGSAVAQSQTELGTQQETFGGWTNNPKHIQDYRISKKAVYTSNFAPPAALLPTPC